MQLCEDFPCGGIGPDGPMQGELDDAIESGHPIGRDDTYHRGQQIWINLNEIAGMVTHNDQAQPRGSKTHETT
jgi:hypothetical protein